MSSELAAPARRAAPPGHTAAAPPQPTPHTQDEDSASVDTEAGDTNGEASSRGNTQTSNGTGITCRLEELLAERAMTMTELSRRTGITMANLSIMKNNKAKAIRMTTMAALCQTLRVTPGQLLVLDGDTT